MAKRKAGLAAASNAIDPTIDALFSGSAGPTKAPEKSRYSSLLEKKQREAPLERAALNPIEGEEDEEDDEELSEISEELDDEDEDQADGADSDDGSDPSGQDGSDSSEAGVEGEKEPESALPTVVDEPTEELKPRKDRKRRRNDENDDLEEKYLAELAKEEPAEPQGKRQKKDTPERDQDGDQDMSEGETEKPPVHESLAQEDAKSSELEKAARTVFVSNVASEAVSSKGAKKTLLAHLSSLQGEGEPPIESIRFRSVAFSTGSMPKRAAYITKAVMATTTKSANAYVVYASPAAARKAAAELNGSEVLGRHIRVDSVAHPSPTDHRRCVFVGNLGFVDDESVLTTNDEGEQVQKKRNKVPADIEEGLWRTFGTQGKVENVRVVRDPKTRVGKGFAYVQFYDANDVESAILLDGKKFPPMLPRPLRVTRAKDPRKTALAQERASAREAAINGAAKRTKYQPKATPEQQSMAGRAGKLLGRSGAALQKKAGPGPKKSSGNALAGMKTPEHIVLEGRRASSRDGLPKDLKFGKKAKGKGKPKSRGARRGAEWKKSKK